MNNRILISFQHAVAALVDRRVLLIYSAVCEEIFQSMTSIEPKDLVAEAPEVAESHPATLVSQLKDFPLLIRVLTLADGVEIESPPELIVKWSNIAAICNLSDEQWTVLRKPPRKRKKSRAQNVVDAAK